MQMIKNRYVWLGALILLGVLLSAGFVWLPAWQFQSLLKAYQAEDFLKAKQAAESLLESHPHDPRAEIVLAEILFQEGEFEAAEKRAGHALQSTSQAVHDGRDKLIPWLGRLFHLRSLFHLRQALDLQEQDGWEWLARLTEVAQEDIDQAYALNPEHARWKAAKTFSLALQEQSKTKLIYKREWWIKWKQFVKDEPLFKRLKTPELSYQDPPQKPGSQEPVRIAVREWQSLKRNAFLNQNIESLKNSLTGSALTESISSVQWWRDHPSAIYNDIQLHEMKFLRVDYTGADRARAVVEIDETRDNSEEGRSRSRYRVDYGLVLVGQDWLIESVDLPKAR